MLAPKSPRSSHQKKDMYERYNMKDLVINIIFWILYLFITGFDFYMSFSKKYQKEYWKYIVKIDHIIKHVKELLLLLLFTKTRSPRK